MPKTEVSDVKSRTTRKRARFSPYGTGDEQEASSPVSPSEDNTSNQINLKNFAESFALMNKNGLNDKTRSILMSMMAVTNNNYYIAELACHDLVPRVRVEPEIKKVISQLQSLGFTAEVIRVLKCNQITNGRTKVQVDCLKVTW